LEYFGDSGLSEPTIGRSLLLEKREALGGDPMLSPKVKITEQEGVRVLSLRGEFIGGDETDELRNALAKETENETKLLLVDLEDVKYLNSTALGVLISAHTHISKREGKIGLCNISKSIENIFVITKLVLVFNIYDTLEEGLQKIRAGEPSGTSTS
jgi:anti-sigma B factor antagonist